MRARKAVYPASFDPVTNGHVDIARRAATIFDEVIVAVYDTPSKSLLFSTDERLELIRQAVEHLPNVRAVKYTGLTTSLARKEGAQVIIRGLRSITDLELESQQSIMYRRLDPGIEVVALMADLPYTYLSSTIVKQVWRAGGDVEDMVPPGVYKALKAKFGDDDTTTPVPRHLNT